MANWHLFEPSIRRAAGLAAAPDDRIPDHRYETRWWHGDVVVVGAGLRITRLPDSKPQWREVMIVDDHPKAGGHLRASRTVIDGNPALDWVASIVEELDANPEVTRLTTPSWGYRESNQLIVTERNPDEYHVFQRLESQSERVILATGY